MSFTAPRMGYAICARGYAEQTGTRSGTGTDQAEARVLGRREYKAKGYRFAPCPLPCGRMESVLTPRIFPMMA